jgi:hypothetical protein
MKVSRSGWGLPAAVEFLYMFNASAKIFSVQYPALDVPAYSLLISMIEFFNDHIKTTKPPDTDIRLIVSGLFMSYT